MNWKAWLKTPKGKLTVALGILGISWIFLFFHFAGPMDSLFPSQSAIEAKKEALKKLRKENASLKLKMKQQKELEQRYKVFTEASWQGKDGFIETDLRSRVQEAAQKAGLTLNSLGSVKIIKINNDLSFAEIDLQATTSIEVIAAFLSQIKTIKPELCWKRFDVRMNMRFQRNAQQTDNQNLTLNGTLRVIVSGIQEEPK